ncbi:MAG: efflux RND transporter periplasmic adaptor subunit [Endomicrobium sp.]|jgi:membrane fusion protein (multidrug efflux system)|nr:efflux RND transporter periplasmic adaptor subunit [Endomicrobium sp.]
MGNFIEKVKYYFFQAMDNFTHWVQNYRARSPQRFKKLVIIIAVAVVLTVAGIYVYFYIMNKAKALMEEQEFVQVKVMRVKKQDYTDKYTVMGSIKGAVENDMRFELEGQLAMYNFREGSKVKRGENICSLDPKDAHTKADYAKNKYKSEQAALLSAREKLKVYETLLKSRDIAESKVLEARFEIQSTELRVQAAKSELELAQSNLKKTNLAAPSDGILAQVIIKPGEYITPQDVVCKFISDQGTNFEVDIPEKDVFKIAIGQKVKIVSDSYADRDFDGVVAEIAPTVDPRTRTSKVKVNVENEQGHLRSGMFARGTIHLKEMKNVVLVPSDSVISLNNTTFLVPIVVPDVKPGEGIVQMRPCKIGDKVGERTIVLDGLNLGELIVAETQGQLSDGVKVKFIEILEEDNPVPVEY